MSDLRWGFVAVHSGAGQHAPSLDQRYKQGAACVLLVSTAGLLSLAQLTSAGSISGMADACQAAACVLQRQAADPLAAVGAALGVLELYLARLHLTGLICTP